MKTSKHSIFLLLLLAFVFSATTAFAADINAFTSGEEIQPYDVVQRFTSELYYVPDYDDLPDKIWWEEQTDRGTGTCLGSKIKMMNRTEIWSKKGFFHNLERQEKDIILKNLKATNCVTIRQLARVMGVSKYMVEKA